MRKNILTIIVMATSLVNLVLTIVLVFAIMPAMNKTSVLVDKVASVVDLEIEDANAEGEEYTMEDLCMVANMLYSDYCDTFKNIIPKDKEVKYYTKMAEDFLDDKDSSVKGSEKLATYYYCIVSEE